MENTGFNNTYEQEFWNFIKLLNSLGIAQNVMIIGSWA